MYTSFFGLNEKPFSITPDPRYLFMSARHGEALAHLVYGVTESGGFVQLTGEVGTGKTTLVRSLLQSRMPSNADVAVVLNPQISAREFLITICEELPEHGSLSPSDLAAVKARQGVEMLTGGETRVVDEEGWKKRLERSPMGRLSTPEGVARVVVFLASDAADCINGDIVFVDGGRSISAM